KQRKGNCGRVSLLSNPQVFEVVREHFCEDLWSPEEISNRLAAQPNRSLLIISSSEELRNTYL
ncbi:MAG: IS30 family transposase, partial [Lactobacillus sp.]